jgi:RNA polymerase sigma factor (sigma-70 family)
MPYEPDHLLLRRYARARAEGRDDEAAGAWEHLAVKSFDRIKALCQAFRFPGGGGGLPPDEVGSAASEAYLRVVAMGRRFREHEVGQYQAAVYSVVHNTCLDYGRKELRHERRRAGSLDQTWEPGGEGGPYDAALAAYDAERRAEAHEALHDEAARQDAARLVRWGIAQVRNAKHREVLELTYLEKLDGEQIAERLGISVDNVYQRRRRGLKELERILRAPRS